MPQLFYLSKIETVEDPTIGTVVRHRLQIAHPGVEYLGGEIAGDPGTGQPLHPALLVLVAGDDHTPYQHDPKLVPIPVASLDSQIIGIGTEAKLATREAVVALGFSQADVDSVWANSETLRDAINWHGRLNNPTFDVNAFSLSQF